MPRFTALDHVTHSSLKVKIRYGAAFGNNVNQTLVFPTEFQALQREYPLFFRQSDDRKFYAVALLGLDKDENLFIEADHWNARYVPAMHMRGPLTLKLRGAESGSAEPADPIVSIDMDDARVNNDEGENLFLTHGGYSPYFEEMLQVLRRIHVGAEIVDDFFAHLQSFDLIEPVTVEASFGETMKYTVPDVFTVSKSRMQALTGDELHKLNQLGLLEHCFAVISSAGNMSRLVDMKALKKSQTR
ncbi:SapC family protein [Exilibacterium tricleocarpae]|uniref:SapC family protein n=1 Tax=Exilibacterium tricleocarpae TaxID=2591008 RepID=A0A545TLX4_9GAMM|nr:SapC family protein [Exilibacterium tricleocarpae]TQV78176.1 SapC family protein [Exilibacterium tricleocarpae]